jgi:phosphate transport system protein
MATVRKSGSSPKGSSGVRKTRTRAPRGYFPHPTADTAGTPDLHSDPDLLRLGLHACLVARDAVTNLAEGLAHASSLALVTVKECEAELDEIDRYVDERIAADLTSAPPKRVKELLACLKFVLDLERIGDLVLTIVGRVRAYGAQMSAEDRGDLHDMCKLLEQMLTLVHQANVERELPPALAALKLDGEMDTLRTRIYSRQVTRRTKDIALSLEIFLMAQALERAGDHAKNLAEEVCHLIQGRTMRHQRAFHT